MPGRGGKLLPGRGAKPGLGGIPGRWKVPGVAGAGATGRATTAPGVGRATARIVAALGGAITARPDTPDRAADGDVAEGAGRIAWGA